MRKQMPENKVAASFNPKDYSLAQVMYQAYGETTDFKNFQGNPMPAWEELPEGIQKAWIAAAKKARFVVIKETMATALDNIFLGSF
jgi:hypothetical protein